MLQKLRKVFFRVYKFDSLKIDPQFDKVWGGGDKKEAWEALKGKGILRDKKK